MLSRELSTNKTLNILSLFYFTIFFILSVLSISTRSVNAVYTVHKSPMTQLRVATSNNIMPRKIHVAFEFLLEKGWHSYFMNPGEAGLEAMIDWELPRGFTLDTVHYPTPQSFNEQGLITYGYSKRNILIAELSVNGDLPNKFDVSGSIQWLVCKDVCIPEKADFRVVSPRDFKGKSNLAFDNKLIKSVLKKLPRYISSKKGEIKNSTLSITVPTLRIRGKKASITEVDFYPARGGIIYDEKNFSSVISDDEITFSFRLVPEHKIGEFPFIYKIKTASGKILSFKSSVIIDKNLNVQPSVSDWKFRSSSLNNGRNSRVNFFSFDNFLSNFSADDYISELMFAMLFAVLGGMILNLMPCVLPILSLKIFEIASAKSVIDRRKTGLYYMVGVSFTFTIFAIITIILRSKFLLIFFLLSYAT